jgi:uncharacterized membrane protein YkvA (DUF1232 family)
MHYLKPYTTLAIGAAIGYFLVPKVIARVGG